MNERRNPLFKLAGNAVGFAGTGLVWVHILGIMLSTFLGMFVILTTICALGAGIVMALVISIFNGGDPLSDETNQVILAVSFIFGSICALRILVPIFKRHEAKINSVNKRKRCKR